MFKEKKFYRNFSIYTWLLDERGTTELFDIKYVRCRMYNTLFNRSSGGPNKSGPHFRQILPRPVDAHKRTIRTPSVSITPPIHQLVKDPFRGKEKSLDHIAASLVYSVSLISGGESYNRSGDSYPFISLPFLSNEDNRSFAYRWGEEYETLID